MPPLVYTFWTPHLGGEYENTVFYWLIAALSLAALSAYAQSGTGTSAAIPHLQKQGTATQLIVDGKPFLMLAGELRNSTTSSLEFMKPVWPKLVAMHLNTVLAAVQWELMEPKEGKFDFTLVDGQIRAAESNNLRLIFLWFGSWKNGVSSYLPAWVKTNLDRFPRAQTKDGKSTETLSTLSAANLDADSRAFAALMRHVKEVDSSHRVIMIQVENEVGLGRLAGQERSGRQGFRGTRAEGVAGLYRRHKDTLYPQFRKAWEAAGSKTSGTWEEVFGKTEYTDEIFMAWNYAQLCRPGGGGGQGRISAAHVREHLRAPCPAGPAARDVPSGGPQPDVGDLWKVGAPAIDFRGPDLHTPNFSDWVNWYQDPSFRSFPCSSPRRTAHGTLTTFSTSWGSTTAWVSPLCDRRSAFHGSRQEELELTDLPLARSYDTIAQLTPLILENQGKGKMAGAVVIADEPPQKIPLGNYVLEVSYPAARRDPRPAAAGAPATGACRAARTTGLPERAGVLFIAVGPDEYIAASSGPVKVRFSPNTPGDPIAGIHSIEEGTFVDGRWVPGRRLNGDENGGGTNLRLGGDESRNGLIQRIKLYRYR